MLTIPQVIDTLQNLTNAKINQADIARKLNITPATVSARVKSGSRVTFNELQTLERAYNVDLVKQNINNLCESFGIEKLDTQNVKIPYRPDVYLSAGYGVEVYSESAEFITLDSRLFMTDRGNKINPAHCEVVRISGSSMEPEYRHGDRVIIDRDDTEFLDGHIFAFRYKGQCYVKEINVIGDKIKCISLNKEYEPFYIKQGEEFTVFGRILPRIRL